MPLYEVTHAIPLTEAQHDALAEAITTIHLTKFPMTPALFVNVTFTDNSQQVAYIGGRRRHANHIGARVRLGNRAMADFEEVRDRIDRAWTEIVVAPAREKLGEAEAAKCELQTLVIAPANYVGQEAGFEIPQAGLEGEWLRKYLPKFRERAEAGDPDFVDLVRSVDARGGV